MLGQMYLSIIECPKYAWHAAFGHKRLCYRSATAGTSIFSVLCTESKVGIYETIEKITTNSYSDQSVQSTFIATLANFSLCFNWNGWCRLVISPVPTVILFSRSVNFWPSIRGMFEGNVKRTVAWSPGMIIFSLPKRSSLNTEDQVSMKIICMYRFIMGFDRPPSDFSRKYTVPWKMGKVSVNERYQKMSMKEHIWARVN